MSPKFEFLTLEFESSSGRSRENGTRVGLESESRVRVLQVMVLSRSEQFEPGQDLTIVFMGRIGKLNNCAELWLWEVFGIIDNLLSV
jgi:hypothetical protein